MSQGFGADLMREVTAPQQHCNLKIHQCILLQGLGDHLLVFGQIWLGNKAGVVLVLGLKDVQWRERVWEFHPPLLPVG